MMVRFLDIKQMPIWITMSAKGQNVGGDEFGISQLFILYYFATETNKAVLENLSIT